MKVVIYVYNGMTLLDAIGPYEVLRSVPGAEVMFVAKSKGEIHPDSRLLNLDIKHRIKEVTEADILIIPGSTIGFVREMKDKKVLNWIQSIHEKSQWTTSVCTGSIILAAAGILKGLHATSHWKTLNMLSEYEATPLQERWVEQGKVITAAGVSAGIDMALHLASKIAGEEGAKLAQLMIEYDPKPPYQSGNAALVEESIREKASELLEKQAEEELSWFQKIWSFGTLRKLQKEG
ncbi:MAG: DJ-1/PfpI family protein [Bacteroidota bacterium]